MQSSVPCHTYKEKWFSSIHTRTKLYKNISNNMILINSEFTHVCMNALIQQRLCCSMTPTDPTEQVVHFGRFVLLKRVLLHSTFSYSGQIHDTCYNLKSLYIDMLSG